MLYLGTEKKLLQSKLRKASAGGKSVDTTKSSVNKKDVCTSTEDLGTSVMTETWTFLRGNKNLLWRKFNWDMS